VILSGGSGLRLLPSFRALDGTTIGTSADGVDDAAFDLQRGAIGRGRLFRGDIDDHVGDLVDAGKTLQQRIGAMLLDEVGGRLLNRLAALLCNCLEHRLNAIRHGRSGQHRIHCHRRAARQLCEPARDRELCGLGHAVVDHLGRDVQPGFGGDENDAAPSCA